MWYSEEEIEIALKEYVCGNELIRHYDTIDWVVGSIFIPISLGLLSLSFTEPIVKLDTRSLVVLALGSCFSYFFWLMVDHRCHIYSNAVFTRLHELEEKYGMKTHREITREVAARSFGQAERSTVWVWILFVVLVHLWFFRIFFVKV